MKLSLIIILLFSLQSFAADMKTCTIENGVIEGAEFQLDISSDKQSAVWSDNAENSMSCSPVAPGVTNNFLENFEDTEPATDEDTIFFCRDNRAYTLSIIRPDNTGQFFIGKFAFTINCK